MSSSKPSTRLSLSVFIVCVITDVLGTGCQHACECGFEWTDDGVSDEDVTLRYEVMAGLVGGFAPLVLAGLAALIYKLCKKGSSTAASAAGNLGSPALPHMALANPFSGGPWRNSGRDSDVSGPPGYDKTRGSTPISVYGETDDDFLAKASASQSGRPGTVNSKYTNIHRNVKSDLVNQWFKNVNLKRY